ncbi:Uncharacterised protein [uncultured archaeon]|nr:Uncharacterised protein [uncultured archaeon]
MNIENFFEYEIRKTLCDSPRNNFGYYQANSNIKKNIIEYVFGNSKINFPSTSLNGALGLRSFRALAESENFSRLVFNDKRILSLTKEIKEIYLNKIINQERISSADLIENHMKPLVRILFDPYISSEEFYQRASLLKRNLLMENKTYVSEHHMFPKYYSEQEKIIQMRDKRNLIYNQYRMAA